MEPLCTMPNFLDIKYMNAANIRVETPLIESMNVSYELIYVMRNSSISPPLKSARDTPAGSRTSKTTDSSRMRVSAIGFLVAEPESTLSGCCFADSPDIGRQVGDTPGEAVHRRLTRRNVVLYGMKRGGSALRGLLKYPSPGFVRAGGGGGRTSPCTRLNPDGDSQIDS